MSTVFSIALEKGGVAKSTSGQALAVEAAWDGITREWPQAKKRLKQAEALGPEHVATALQVLKQREIAILSEIPPRAILGADGDAQRNFGMGLGVMVSNGEPSMSEVLLNSEYGIDYAVRQSSSGVYILPSTLNLSEVSDELKVDRERRLLQAFREAEGYEGHPIQVQAVDQYKVIFIDCPPNMGLLTMNALAASDYVLVPMQAHFYAYEAMANLENTIDIIKRRRKINRKLEIGGIFCSMYDPRTNLSDTIQKQLRQRFGSLVFETIVPMNVDLAEAPVFGLSIQQYNHLSAGAKAYAALYREIKGRFNL